MRVALFSLPLRATVPRVVFVGMIGLFLTLACNVQPSAYLTPSPTAVPTGQHSLLPALNSLRVGWAYEAYPDRAAEQMREDMQHMRDSGADAIWIGHNNPGEVDANKVEPGLSYAVYAALQDSHDPRYSDGRAMVDAVKRALEAARAVKLQVILPIGYQIQMGAAWNAQHPDDLRRDAAGKLLNIYNSGVTASPYAVSYRADITRYYDWIQSEWVKPYSDVVVMLSLADEPMGGDYSAPAKAAFVERYGVSMYSLAPADRWKLGEFQAGVIVDYAAWSAAQWKQINPSILTTISFHGGDTARRVWGLPDIERLFSDTPDNFVVTFDAYLHDYPPQAPMPPDEIIRLDLFLATIGHYSAVYHKPLALWGGANAWGLAQESSTPLGVPDAVTNLFLLYDIPARAGAEMWGVFAWNYNVKAQGLYNYSHATTYDTAALEIAVERAFPALRRRPPPALVSALDIAIFVSSRALYTALATTRAADLPPPWFDATAYARAFANENAAVVTSARSLSDMPNAAYWIITCPPAQLDSATLALLRDRFARGQIILGDTKLAQALGVRSQLWSKGMTSLPTKGGLLYALTDLK